jgi:hypothetical protein
MYYIICTYKYTPLLTLTLSLAHTLLSAAGVGLKISFAGRILEKPAQDSTQSYVRGTLRACECIPVESTGVLSSRGIRTS